VIRRKPDYAPAHNLLGTALSDLGKPDEATAEIREAIRLDPNNAEARCNLGLILLDGRRYAEALEELRQGHALGSKQPGWQYPSAQWVRDAERMVALDARLPAVVRGEDHPKDAAECLALAKLCEVKALHATAARLKADAFAADPRLADDRRAQHRYNAACSAALAATGNSKDDPPPDEASRARLRKQALDWLRAEVTAWSKLLEAGKADDRATVQKILMHWRTDADLAAFRDPEGLARLPEAERADWLAIWIEVGSLLTRSGGQTPCMAG
jgi:tetratricopeptide (TPR) repeat protein